MRKILKSGRNINTPCAFVEKATTKQERMRIEELVDYLREKLN